MGSLYVACRYYVCVKHICVSVSSWFKENHNCSRIWLPKSYQRVWLYVWIKWLCECCYIQNDWCMHCYNVVLWFAFYVQAVITQNRTSNVFLNSEDKILRRLHTICKQRIQQKQNFMEPDARQLVPQSFSTVLSHYKMLWWHSRRKHQTLRAPIFMQPEAVKNSSLVYGHHCTDASYQFFLTNAFILNWHI